MTDAVQRSPGISGWKPPSERSERRPRELRVVGPENGIVDRPTRMDDMILSPRRR